MPPSPPPAPAPAKSPSAPKVPPWLATPLARALAFLLGVLALIVALYVHEWTVDVSVATIVFKFWLVVTGAACLALAFQRLSAGEVTFALALPLSKTSTDLTIRVVGDPSVRILGASVDFPVLQLFVSKTIDSGRELGERLPEKLPGVDLFSASKLYVTPDEFQRSIVLPGDRLVEPSQRGILKLLTLQMPPGELFVPPPDWCWVRPLPLDVKIACARRGTVQVQRLQVRATVKASVTIVFAPGPPHVPKNQSADDTPPLQPTYGLELALVNAEVLPVVSDRESGDAAAAIELGNFNRLFDQFLQERIKLADIYMKAHPDSPVRRPAVGI